MLSASDSFLQPRLARNWIFLGAFLLLGQCAVIAGQVVNLTWNPDPDTNAVGYNIFYGGASGVYTNTIFAATNAATISGLSDGTTYYFAATTVSATGSQSALSTEVAYTTSLADTNPPATTTTNTTSTSTNTVNLQPTLGSLANLTFFQGTAPQTVILTGIPASSASGKSVFRISATSSNPRLIPAPQIRYPSADQPAQLILRPSPFDSGTATITVVLSGAGVSNNVVRQAFTVEVLPIPPPTLDPIADVSVAQGAGLQTYALTGISSGLQSFNQSLQVTVSTSNPRLVLHPVIQYTSPANTASLTFSPSATMVGGATVTVMVTDETLRHKSVQRSFKVTVTPAAPQLSMAVSPSSSKTLTPTGTNVEATLTNPVRSNGQFSFQVTGLTGGSYVLQESSDMTHWTSVETNLAPFSFCTTTTDGISQRFYRAFYLK